MYLCTSVSEYLYKARKIFIYFLFFFSENAPAPKCILHFDQQCVKREEQEQKVGKSWLNVLNLLPPLHIAQQI